MINLLHDIGDELDLVRFTHRETADPDCCSIA